MTILKKGFYGFLRGSFLTDESAVKNWQIMLFVVLLLLIMISSAHSAEAKVYKIGELNKKKRELNAIYIDTKTTLMQMQMESSIKERAKEFGLQSPVNPPQKIKVIVKK